MAKLPTIAAYAYKKSIGQPFLYPDNSLDLIENFLRMMFAVPSEPYEVDPTIGQALEQLLILHADHEQNCSTSTVRLVGSSEANLFASIAAGINALWGPLHGGANQAVIEMLEAIEADGGDVDKYVAGPRTRTTRSGSPGSGTASTRTTTRAPQILKRRRDERARASSASEDQLLDIALRARGGRAHRRVLRRAQALPERRLLLGPHLPGDGLPHADVPGAVRDRPPARLDRALEGDDREPGHQDRPAAPDLHR